jgi:hypothetical protein
MKRLILTATVLAALLVAAFAQAAISVYKASFSSRADYKSVSTLVRSSGACDREWRNKEALGVKVKGGPADCVFVTPVEGDSKQPDLIVQATAKVTKGTKDKVRESVYVGVTVRANKKEGYELRVFPKQRRWQLLKNGDVLAQDRDKKIEGIAKKNKLEISAVGGTVIAKVNNKKMKGLKDKKSEQVGGRKTGLTFGDRKDTKKAKGEGFFDKVKVQVPAPK